METVNNLTAAASRAVFGTNTANTASESAGQEPVSGALGDVKKGEPYDKGNLETPTGEGTEPISGEKGDVKKGEPFDMGNSDPQPTTSNETGTGQQSSKEPPAGSPTGPLPDAFKGPGPQAVEMKSTEGGTLENKLDTEDGKGGKINEEKGTGVNQVKTSSTQAEGSNLDAGKAGSGKEADRIVAEKSVTPNATATKASDSGKAAGTEGSPATKKEKVSLKDKIKAKLHKHKD